MMLEKVQQYIESEHPTWWKAFEMSERWGYEIPEIADELNVTPARVYQLIIAAKRLGGKFYKENK